MAIAPVRPRMVQSVLAALFVLASLANTRPIALANVFVMDPTYLHLLTCHIRPHDQLVASARTNQPPRPASSTNTINHWQHRQPSTSIINQRHQPASSTSRINQLHRPAASTTRINQPRQPAPSATEHRQPGSSTSIAIINPHHQPAASTSIINQPHQLASSTGRTKPAPPTSRVNQHH